MSLENQSVVLTGGAGGIGALVARELLSRGADLTVVDRVDSLPFRASYIKGDLGSEAGIAVVAKQLAERPVDLLINLAGIQHFGPLGAQAPGHVLANYMVNLVAPVLLAQAVLPQMKARHCGQIANVGSIFGSINYAHFVTYSSAKAGLKGFSEALRRECSSFGVDVTYIAPRAVKTALNTPAVMRFAQITDMNMDEPDSVARRIVAAIAARKKDVYFGFPESLFVRINAIAPRIVDAALAKTDRLAAALFTG